MTSEDEMGGPFGQCLGFLLFTHGARPDGSPEKIGRRWSQSEFADALSLSSRTVRYWLDNEKLPSDLASIERVIFGTNVTFDPWRKALRASLEKARTASLPPASVQVHQIVHDHIAPVSGFIGREDLLESIDEALWQKGGTVALTNNAISTAVKGLAGVGKSTLAREYAWRARARYHGVWWVRAEAEQSLVDDLIDLGRRLIPDLKKERKRDEALRRSLEEIGVSGPDKPWLIVYDNVERPSAIAKLTPKTAAHILITSRWSLWQDRAQELQVDVFPQKTAVDFLIAARPHETREVAGRLAAALGYLPLALSYARAYCVETNLSFDDYERRLPELLQEAPDEAEYPASVFATFSLAIAKATEICPEAEKLMEIAAFLAPERIPLDIITDDVMTKKQRERAVAALFKISLVSHDTLDGGKPGISMHRLVQEAMRTRLGDRANAIAQNSLRLIGKAFTAGPIWPHTGWPRIILLLPHAICIADSPYTSDNADDDYAKLSAGLGLYFHACAEYTLAERWYQKAIRLRDKISGAEHEESAALMNNIAELYRRTGRYGEAEECYKQAVSVREKVLGPLHENTATSLNNLVFLYLAQNRYNEAAQYASRAEAICDALEEGHPETIRSINAVASLYRAQREFDKAEKLYSRALEIREKRLEGDHPDIAFNLNILGEVYREMGRYQEAEPLHLRALAIRKKAYGPEDPRTLTSQNNLAALYIAQGRCDDAEPLCQFVVDTGEKTLDANYPEKAEWLSNLADLRYRQGRHDDAASLYARAASIFEMLLGPDHPKTKNAHAASGRKRE